MAAHPGEGLAAARSKDPGERAFQFCFSCHSVNPDESDLPGPNLFGVVGRPIAALPGYKYSAGLKAFAQQNGVWTPALLDRFIQDPTGAAPGTRMEQPPGIEDPKVRQLVMKYLNSQK